jgi:hypothetical protein
MTRQDHRRIDHDKTAASQQAGDEPLTDAQRAFARLLGQLLAEKWRDENASRPRKPRDQDESSPPGPIQAKREET